MIFRRKNKAEQDTQTNAAENVVVPSAIISRYLTEQRRRRRWGIFFKLVMLSYVGVLVYYFTTDSSLTETIGSHTAVVEINGIIAPKNVSASRVNDSLRAAFANTDSKGIIIKINSPGGTPVQASQINQEIIRLKQRYPEKPVYAAISDIGTSGAYYVAVAADEIYAHPSSIIGSIGVVMQGFGFAEGIKKLGIQRRVITAGKNKDFLDPFVTENPQQVAHVQSMLDEVHQQFIAAVKQGRGDRLQANSDIYSGLIWSGESAKQLGLIDAFGSADQIARDVIGVTDTVNYTKKESFYKLFANEIGTLVSKTLETLQPSITLR